jgi:hypothetical protein
LSTSPSARAQPPNPYEGCPLFITIDEEDRDPKRLTQLMTQGIEEYRKKNWPGALEAFHEVWCVERSASSAAPLADVEMKLGNYGAAAAHWEFVLKNLPADRTKQRAVAETQLAECREHLGRVQVSFDDPSAKIYVDGYHARETRPGEDLWLEPGVYDFGVATDKWQSGRIKTTVEAGRVHSVVFRAPAPPAPSVTTAAERRPAQRDAATPARDDSGSHSSSARTAVLITGTGLSLVALGTGIVFTLEANAAEEDWETIFNQLEPGACASSPDRPPLCDDLREKVEASDAASNRATGSFIAAGVLAAATAATYFLWPVEKKDSPSRTTVSFAPLVLDGTNGVQVHVGF